MMPGSGGGMGGQGQGMYMNLNGGDRDNYAPSSVPSQVRKIFCTTRLFTGLLTR